MNLKPVKLLLPALFFVFICWIIFQADLDQDNLIIEIGHSVWFGDKIGHFLLYGILALLLNRALNFKRFQLYRWSVLLGSSLVLVFAIAEEFSQLAFASRTFDLTDMLFDILGIWLLSSSLVLNIRLSRK